MKKFSIVVPIFFNEPNIPHLIPRLKELETELPGYSLEFIFVDDGSMDASFELLAKEQKIDKRIKVIKLSRNFGSMSAIQAGLKYVTGDCAGIIAADLQDPPELFIKMIKKWETGKKVVMGLREGRDDGTVQNIFSNTYYRLIRSFAIKDYPEGGFDMAVIDRQIVDELCKIAEKNTNIMSLIFWLGHERDAVSYIRKKREVGKTRWTLSKKIKLFIDTFVNFSYAPIRFMSFLGFVTALMSFLYCIVVIVLRLFDKIPVEGWTVVVAILTLFLGLIMIMLGIIGEYLWRIFDEIRKRPGYVVDKVIID